MEQQRQYTIDDLPRFSPWPARLLGVEQWEVRRKTPEAVLREYDGDKWGRILSSIEQAERPVTLDEVDRRELDLPVPALAWVRDAFVLMSYPEAHGIYMRMVAETLSAYTPASAVAELGCGYGSIVLKLARSAEFEGVPFYAADYTGSGVAAAQQLAATEGLSVQFGRCDFARPDLTDLDLPEGAVIFTSFATPYVPDMPEHFVEALLARRPKAVVHFEPLYEHADPGTLLGMMRRRYLEVNDYNRNLMTLLRTFHDRGTIRIEREEPAVFGSNPLLSASVVVWRPAEQEHA